MAIVWHPCRYIDFTLEHDGSWIDGRWYEWEDIHGNREIARMKLDAIDHFYPETKTIKEEDVCRYREIEEVKKKKWLWIRSAFLRKEYKMDRITLKELYKALEKLSEHYPDYYVMGSATRTSIDGTFFVLYCRNNEERDMNLEIFIN